MGTNCIELITYAKEGEAIEILKSKANQIRTAHLIYHDKDVKEDGTQKEPHLHICLLLAKSREPEEICNWFKNCEDENGKVNTLYKPIKYPKNAHLYLTHETKECIKKKAVKYPKDKIKYIIGNIDEFLLHETDYMKKEGKAIADEGKQQEISMLITDIMIGMPLRYMAMKYGKDFMRNYKNYKEFAKMVAQEEGYTLEGEENGNQGN